MFIPETLIDNKPVLVAVELPQAWIARDFAEWAKTAFVEYVLANEGVELSLKYETENVTEGGITLAFVRK